ncbi:MAG TPA: ribonuclease P protein component [Parafilimonas sp.]|nr:ribonuclease P protein component [Parafilimonas sp.]
MPIKQFSFKKKERLKSRKQLDRIFTKGKSITAFPLKIFYEFSEDQDNIIKTGVGVSRRNFKKAVDRNRIKRLLRESYRTEKVELLNFLEQNKKQIALFFLYIDKTEPDYLFLKQTIQKAIKKLISEMAS